MQLKPVERNSLVEAVVTQLLGLIQDGTLAPGERLPSERELMKSLGVGRSTVREALRSLAMMNLVDLRPGLGSFVHAADLGGLVDFERLSVLGDRSLGADLLELRRLFEPQAAELAAQRASQSDLAGLQAILDQIRQERAAGRPGAELCDRLHLGIVRCTHNQALALLIEAALRLLTERGIELEPGPEQPGLENEAHLELVGALLARDGDLARRLMAGHLEALARSLPAQRAGKKGE